LGDEKAAVRVPDDAGCDVAAGAFGAGGSDGEFFLNAFALRQTLVDDGADQTAGIGWGANGGAQVHQGLIKVTGASGG